jgi:hypothetical protein
MICWKVGNLKGKITKIKKNQEKIKKSFDYSLLFYIISKQKRLDYILVSLVAGYLITKFYFK